MNLTDEDAVVSKNITTCASYDIPTIHQYLSATNIYGIIIVTVGTTALLLVLGLFIDTLLYIMKNSSPRVKAHSAFVIGVYPVTSLATYFAVLVPRAHLLAESITQGMFMAGMYQLFCLFVAYCGGEAELVNKVKPTQLSLKVGPCCCWPCCFLLPSFDVTKKTVRRLRLLVLQLPVVQGLVYLILLVMWAERESLYQINYMYIQPVVICSILIGIWSMSMTINILKTSCEKYLLIGKFMVLQMVLIFAKLQGLSTRALVWFQVLPCRPPITPQVYANLIHNTLMLSEMVLLGAIARYLYKRSLPEITTMSTRISTIGAIMTGESVNNNIVTCDNFNNTIIAQDKKADNGLSSIIIQENKIETGLNGIDNMGADIKE